MKGDGLRSGGSGIACDIVALSDRRSARNLEWVEVSRISGPRHVPALPLSTRRSRQQVIIDGKERTWPPVGNLAILQRSLLGNGGAFSPGRAPKPGRREGNRLGFVRLGGRIVARTSLASLARYPRYSNGQSREHGLIQRSG